MYSPKIKEEYIPFIYEIAKRRKMPMTQLVNEIIGYGLRRIDQIKDAKCGVDYYMAQMK